MQTETYVNVQYCVFCIVFSLYCVLGVSFGLVVTIEMYNRNQKYDAHRQHFYIHLFTVNCNYVFFFSKTSQNRLVILRKKCSNENRSTQHVRWQIIVCFLVVKQYNRIIHMGVACYHLALPEENTIEICTWSIWRKYNAHSFKNSPTHKKKDSCFFCVEDNK